MNDVALAPRRLPTLFVYVEDLNRQVKAIDTWVKRENRKIGRLNTVLVWCLAAAGIVIMLQAGALNWAVPLIRLVPVFFYARADGATEFALTTDSMPADLADAVAQSALWQYVQHRESYSWTEVDWNHHVVMAMSDQKIADAYDKWASGQNPDSYLRTYSQQTVIRTGMRGIRAFERATSFSPGTIIIRYERAVFTRDAPTQSNLWEVTLHYVHDYSGKGLHIRDVLEFNPTRIVVVGYDAPIDLSKDTPK